MDIYQFSEMLSVDADSGSFLVSLVIAVLFYFKYRQLENETSREEMVDSFLRES